MVILKFPAIPFSSASASHSYWLYQLDFGSYLNYLGVMLNDVILVYLKFQDKRAVHLEIVSQVLRNHQFVAKKPRHDYWKATVKSLELKISHDGNLNGLN